MESISYGQGEYNAKKIKGISLQKNPVKEIITREQANEVVNHPELTAQKFEQRQTSAGANPPKADRDYLNQLMQSDEDLGLGDMAVGDMPDNYRQWDSGKVEDLGGIAKNFPEGGVDVPIDPDTHLSGGILPKDIMASITGERFNAPEMADAGSAYRAVSYTHLTLPTICSV